jgi:hypothetical protein
MTVNTVMNGKNYKNSKAYSYSGNMFSFSYGFYGHKGFSGSCAHTRNILLYAGLKP